MFILKKDVGEVAKKVGLSQKQVLEVSEAIEQFILDSVKEDGKYTGNGVTVKIIDVKARKGINPKTKAVIEIPAKKRLTFKASKKIQDLFNN